jgi:hypothetical protein
MAQVYRLSHGFGEAALPTAAKKALSAAAPAGGAPAEPAPAAAAQPQGEQQQQQQQQQEQQRVQQEQQREHHGTGEESSLVAHGFMNILLGMFAHKPPPTHMAVVVDAPGATFRRGPA